MPVAKTATVWDAQAFQDALTAAATGVLRIQDVALQVGQLQRLISALPEHSEQPGRKKVDQAVFQNASFPDDARFDGVIFMDLAFFGGARFEGDAFFGATTFTQGATFTAATFGGEAYFQGATYGPIAVEGDASFLRARFGEPLTITLRACHARFIDAEIQGGVDLS